MPSMRTLLWSCVLLGAASAMPGADTPQVPNLSSIVDITYACPSSNTAHPNVICNAAGTLSKPNLLKSGRTSSTSKW